MLDTISSINSQLGIHVVIVMPSLYISVESVHTYKFIHAQIRLDVFKKLSLKCTICCGNA
jgi:hypothetical protein